MRFRMISFFLIILMFYIVFFCSIVQRLSRLMRWERLLNNTQICKRGLLSDAT